MINDKKKYINRSHIVLEYNKRRDAVFKETCQNVAQPPILGPITLTKLRERRIRAITKPPSGGIYRCSWLQQRSERISPYIYLLSNDNGKTFKIKITDEDLYEHKEVKRVRKEYKPGQLVYYVGTGFINYDPLHPVMEIIEVVNPVLRKYKVLYKGGIMEVSEKDVEPFNI